MGEKLPSGTVHDLPADLFDELTAHAVALAAWHDITPLARNEFICWVDDAKRDETRKRRIRRTREELEEGMRRPCCWPGCSHRERNGHYRVWRGVLGGREVSTGSDVAGEREVSTGSDVAGGREVSTGSDVSVNAGSQVEAISQMLAVAANARGLSGPERRAG